MDRPCLDNFLFSLKREVGAVQNLNQEVIHMKASSIFVPVWNSAVMTFQIIK